MSGPFALGVDVGGTKILGGLIDCSTGQVLHSIKANSPIEGAEALSEAVTENVARVLNQVSEEKSAKVSVIGLGLAGQVDPSSGVLLSAPNLGGGVTNVPIAKQLKARFKLPVVLGNDVQVAAVGEAAFGAGKGYDLFACVFVGTGIGGALMVNGQRYGGTSGSAGEIGHIMVRAGGRLCGCGQRGHLEAYASRTAIVAMMREAVEGGQKSILAPLLLDPEQRVKSKSLSTAIDQGDDLAVNTLTRAALYLGLGLASLINLWNPQRIVLGGGVIDRIDLLFNVAAQRARAAALPVPAAGVDIVRAALGDNSGMVGAALMASSTLQSGELAGAK
jgi:glucokinase